MVYFTLLRVLSYVFGLSFFFIWFLLCDASGSSFPANPFLDSDIEADARMALGRRGSFFQLVPLSTTSISQTSSACRSPRLDLASILRLVHSNASTPFL